MQNEIHVEQHTPTSFISAVNKIISTRCTFHDPSHFHLIESMSAIFAIFFHITMLLIRFIFVIGISESVCSAIEQFMLELKCDFHYHLLSIIRCEDEQPTTGPNQDHVTNSNNIGPNNARKWVLQKWNSTQQLLPRLRKADCLVTKESHQSQRNSDFASIYFYEKLNFLLLEWALTLLKLTPIH